MRRGSMVNAVVVAVGIAAGMVLALATSSAAMASTTPPTSGFTVQSDIVYRTVDGEQLLLDAYVPTANTKHRPAIVVVHGGAWTVGNKAWFSDEAGKLATLGYVAFSVNYRLAPAHPYPAAVDDVQAAVRWVRADKQVKTFALDPKRVGALGGSAGGHLVGMLATLGEGNLSTGARVRAAVSWSGPMDLTPLAAAPGGGSVRTFLACSPDPTCPSTTAEASPITHVDKTDAPMLLANSTTELVPVGQANAMDAALRVAGVDDQLVVLPGTRHSRAYSADVWSQTVAFFEQHLGAPPTSSGKAKEKAKA